jgi:hypothetical protein
LAPIKDSEATDRRLLEVDLALTVSSAIPDFFEATLIRTGLVTLVLDTAISIAVDLAIGSFDVISTMSPLIPFGSTFLSTVMAGSPPTGTAQQ